MTSLVALTAHFGSFLYRALLWPVWLAAIFWIAPRLQEGGQEKRILVAVAASFVVACVYYLGYAALFTSQWERVLS